MKNSGLGFISRVIEPKQQIPDDRKRFSDAALKNLIIPIIIEQFLALLVGIADTMMVSYVGEAAVSSVSLVNQLNNVFIMVFWRFIWQGRAGCTGFGTGVSAYISVFFSLFGCV